jgi:hypothetical protein
MAVALRCSEVEGNLAVEDRGMALQPCLLIFDYSALAIEKKVVMAGESE